MVVGFGQQESRAEGRSPDDAKRNHTAGKVGSGAEHGRSNDENAAQRTGASASGDPGAPSVCIEGTTIGARASAVGYGGGPRRARLSEVDARGYERASGPLATDAPDGADDF